MVAIKGKKFYVKASSGLSNGLITWLMCPQHNTFTEDLPLVIVMKAMGVETDQEIMQFVGSEDEMVACLAYKVDPILTDFTRLTRLRPH